MSDTWHDVECIPGFDAPMHYNEFHRCVDRMQKSYQHLMNLLIKTNNEKEAARRLAEEWRDYAKAWRGSAYSASFMKKPAELPWEWGSQKRRLKWEGEK